MPELFYDEQIRRFLYQFARIFSNFEVESGLDDSGLPVIIQVPIRYGDASRQAQVILQQNSANNIPCAPLMSFYIDSLKYDRPRIQNPTYIDRKHVRQRAWDDTSQTYEQTQGNAFTVEKPMPVPYLLGIKLDIWTTNTNMKLQLLEQILTLFNPSLEIQSTDNYLDWSSLSVVDLDDVNWSSRTVPNNNNDIDIATLKFSIPIWISPPTRVTKGGVIHKVITNIYDESGKYVDAIDSDDLLLGTRLRITPHGYQVLLIGNELRVLSHTNPDDDGNIEIVPDDSSTLSWHAVIDEYGALNSGISQIRLHSDIESETDIIGTIAYHPYDENILLFTIDTDTLNTDTLSPINAVIDPLESGPGAGLPAATLGQRYLLVNNIGNDSDNESASAWFGTSELVANKDDIIEFNGTNWIVSFDANNAINVEYVTNLTTSIQFKFQNGQWLRSYEGIYRGGFWSLVL